MVATATGMLTIAKAPVLVTLAAADLQNQVYNGQPHPVGCSTAPSLAPGSVSVNYSLAGITIGARQALAAAGQPPVNAGHYTVTAVVNHANYTGTAQAALVIAPAAATVTLDAATLSQAFTGSPLAVGYTVVPAEAPVAVTYVGDAYPASTTPPSAAGSYSVTAAITGPNYAGAAATGTLQITGAALTTPAMTLTADANPIQAFQKVTLTVTATAAGGSAPTGKVTFSATNFPLSGDVVLGPSSAGDLASAATLSVSILPAGTWTITAFYSGDDSHASASATLQLVVSPLPGLTLSSPGQPGQPLSVTVSRNRPGTCEVSVQAPDLPFRSPVTFTTIDLPEWVHVAPLSADVYPIPQPSLITFRVTISAIQSGLKEGGAVGLPMGGGAAGAFLACGLLALPWAGRSRRRSRRWTGLALLLAVGLLGCWSRNPSSTTYHGTVVASAANAPAGTPPLATIPVEVTVLQ